jgi:ribosomal protein S18 acetylase RimI-like enzyme
MEFNEVSLRPGKPSDFEMVKSVMDDWWGRNVSHLQQKLFFDHFTSTIIIAENADGSLAGFINGFLSQSDAQLAYIHFVGVAPNLRSTGLGRRLYASFFEICKKHGRTRVESITSKVNDASLNFHKKLGFTVGEADPIRYRFEKVLD